MSGILGTVKKGGGGFLNGVDGLVTGGIFTTNPQFGGEARGGEARGGERGEGKQLFYALMVQQDGAEAPQTTHLFTGQASDFVISDNGHTLMPVDGATLWGGTQFLNFYESLVVNGKDGGFEDVEPGEDGSLTFDHIPGVRARFVQVKDEGAMKRSAESYKKNKPGARKLFNEFGQKIGKDGKYYDQRSVQVEKVYSVDNAITATGSAATATGRKLGARSDKAQSNEAGTPKPVITRGNGKAAVSPAVDEALRIKSGQVLLELLSEQKDGRLAKNRLNLAVTRKLTAAGDDQRDDVRKFLFEDANLQYFAENGIVAEDDQTYTITYEKSGKDQTIALA